MFDFDLFLNTSVNGAGIQNSADPYRSMGDKSTVNSKKVQNYFSCWFVSMKIGLKVAQDHCKNIFTAFGGFCQNNVSAKVDIM